MQTNMANTTTWAFDPTHSELTFKVKHLMIANVKGEFRNFSAQLTTEGDDFSKATAQAIIDVTSIDTNNADRDGHLKSGDFFDAENHPNIQFASTSFQMFDAENGQLKGNLTIKGITNEVSLDVEFGGISQDPWGNVKAGFSLTGKINRNDFGLSWNAALETGGVLVSEEVKLAAEIQFVKTIA
jgi:polyisoprenoid-binding protein YceI